MFVMCTQHNLFSFSLLTAFIYLFIYLLSTSFPTTSLSTYPPLSTVCYNSIHPLFFLSKDFLSSLSPFLSLSSSPSLFFLESFYFCLYPLIYIPIYITQISSLTVPPTLRKLF